VVEVVVVGVMLWREDKVIGSVVVVIAEWQ
jgi:hypothetical protein